MPRRQIEGVSKGDMFRVNPRIIKVQENWNEREDFDGHEELVQSIIENGVINPVRVKRTSDDTELLLVDGERRHRATMEAIERGHDIKSIPAFLVRPTITDTDAKYLSYLSNDGKRFQPLEEATLFNRLLKYGESVSDIAKKIGKSAGYVNNTLILLDGNEQLKGAVKNGHIKKTLAQGIIKKANGNKEEEGDLTLKALKNPKAARNRINRKMQRAEEFCKEEWGNTGDVIDDLCSFLSSVGYENVSSKLKEFKIKKNI